MRNFWIGMLALMLGFCVVSCKEKSEQPVKEGEATEQVAENLSLEDIVAKAKAEGANWTVDDWKNYMRQAFVAAAPLLQKLGDMMKEIGDDPQKAAASLGDLQKLQEEFEPYEKLFDELDSITEANEVGKKVMEDTTWVNQMKKELNIPEDI